ncbi:MAG: tetratricopeptide repeat protein [Geminicoccaceae bacterium]
MERTEIKPLDKAEQEAPLRNMLTRFYERLPEHRDVFQDLLPYTQRALLKTTRDIKADTTAIRAELRALAEQVSTEKGVPLPVLAEILTGFGESVTELAPAAIEQRLRAKADEYRELEKRLRRLTNDDPEVQRLRKLAADLLDVGDFEGADRELAAAEARDLEVVEELEELANRRRISAAESRAERGAAAKLRLAYEEAAEHYAKAAGLMPQSETEGIWRYRLENASCLDDLGREFGDNEALRRAIEAYQRNFAFADRERFPLNWAATQNNLGLALQTLGQRESGTERLEQAVQAYRAALEERTRERVPLDWARTQNNLGSALAILGERESGTKRLERSVQAYNAALEERTRERAPIQWATSKNNLGLALSTLGERESGSERLEQAVLAYTDALKEWTQWRMPLHWAGANNNLGRALWILGERASNVELLIEAQEAVTNARQVFIEEAAQDHFEAYFDRRLQEIEAAIRRLDGGGELPSDDQQ